MPEIFEVRLGNSPANPAGRRAHSTKNKINYQMKQFKLYCENFQTDTSKFILK